MAAPDRSKADARSAAPGASARSAFARVGNVMAAYSDTPFSFGSAGLTALPNAAAEASGGLYTRGTGAGQINQAVNGTINANLTHVAGAANSTTTAQLGVNVVQVNSVATSSVTTVNANVGTTQPVNFTGTGASALVKGDTVDIAGAAVSTSTAQVGANIVQVIGDPVQASSSKTTNWGGTP